MAHGCSALMPSDQESVNGAGGREWIFDSWGLKVSTVEIAPERLSYFSPGDELPEIDRSAPSALDHLDGQGGRTRMKTASITARTGAVASQQRPHLLFSNRVLWGRCALARRRVDMR